MTQEYKVVSIAQKMGVKLQLCVITRKFEPSKIGGSRTKFYWKPIFWGSYPTKTGVRGKSSHGIPVFRIKNLQKWGMPGQGSIVTPDFWRSSQNFSKHPQKRGLPGETCPGTPRFWMFFPRKRGLQQRFSCDSVDLSIKNKSASTKFGMYSPFCGVVHPPKHEFVPPKINV